MSDSTGNSNIESVKKTLATQIKNLRENLIRETDRFGGRAKEKFDQTRDEASKRRDEIKSLINGIVKNYNQFSVEELKKLKENLESQLDKTRNFSNQVIEEQQKKLITSLEESLSTVSQVTSSRKEDLKELIGQVDKLATESSEKSIEIVKNRDQQITDQLTDELKLNKEKLSSEIVNLQDSFRDEMNEKIENVFMGVTMTKEGISGIISDTLSRLEENLNRLTEGIDENFTKQVGETQDLIHDYEGRLLEVVENTQQLYDEHMEEILEKHSQQTQQSLDNLNSELNSFKSDILSKLNNLSSDQEKMLTEATKKLQTTVQKSKSEITQSQTKLKDRIGELVSTNKESINQSIATLQTNRQKNKEQLDKEIAEKMDAAQKLYSQTVSDAKGLVDDSTANMTGHIKQTTSSVENEINKVN